MLTPPSNSVTYRKELIDQLARGRVIVVAGTGVSIAATKSSESPRGHPQASWPGLLEHGLNFIVRKGLASDSVVEPQRLAIKTGDTDSLISAAQVISRKIEAPTSVYYKEWLSETLGSIKAKDLRLLHSLQRLRKADNILATTNYDDLLVEGQPDLQPVTWDDQFELLRVARGRAHGVLFLHGYWRREETIVLDWRSYLALIQDADARSNIEAVWKMTTWLYVGCGEGGLTDPDLGKLIEQFGPSARNAELWDYFLAREEDAGPLDNFFRKRAANIRVLTYGTTYDDLPVFLERLAEESIPHRMGIRGAAPLVELVPITSGFRDFRQAGEDVSASFRPSFEEFKNGLVHRPKTVDHVVAALGGRNWAWLRGVSATGKTTIALHVALETSSADLPALYLDLSDEPDILEVAQEISASSAPGRLFVVDNVHVNPRATASLLRNWEQNANGSRMLLLGWPLDEGTDKRNLVAYHSVALEIGITEEDLEGVYLTLRRRLRSREASVPRPPQSAVHQWFTQFSADLVAFQLAVAAALRTATNIGWTLEEEAAKRYLRDKYLDCNPRERSDLIRLALFSELGLAVSEDCLAGHFEQSLSAGIVRRSTHGRFGQVVRFRLWHQSLGRCLLAANREPVDRAEEFSQVAVASPQLGSFLGQRLWLAGEQELARTVLSLSISSTGGILRAFGDNLHLASRQLRILNTSGVLSFAETSSRLTAKVLVEDLEKLAFATQLHILVSFLSFIAKQPELKPVYESLTQALVAEAAKSAAENRLLAQALATPLGDLPTFLDFVAKQPELKPANESLVQALVAEAAKPAAENRLLAQAFATPLHFLSTFLDFVAKQPELKPAYESLAQALVAEAAKPAAENRLLGQAFAIPVHFLASFFGFVAKQAELKPAYESLVQALVGETAKPAAENRLLAQALATPLGDLPTFLAFVAKQSELRPVLESLAQALVSEVSKPAAENRLLAQALSTPLHILASFLGFVAKQSELRPVYESLAQALVAEAAKSAAENRLLAQALATPLGDLANFLAFVAKQPELKPAYESLVQALVAEVSKPAAENRLLAQAFATPLHFLPTFLDFVAKQPELKPAYESLAQALVAEAAKPAAKNRLLGQAFAIPVHFLASFLGFVAKQAELKPAYESLVQALVGETAKPAAENRLLAQALATPLGDLPTFLAFVAKQSELRPVLESLAQALVSEVSKPAAENRLLAQALAASLEHLAGFLAAAANQHELNDLHNEVNSLLLARADLIAQKIRRARFAQTVALLSVAPNLGTEAIGRITNDDWIEAVGRMAEAPVMGVGRFLGKLAAFGFSEKATLTACALVQRADSKDWENHRIGIFDLSATLRYTRAGANAKRHLIELVATPRWLTYRYYQGQVGTLAGALFHLAAYQPSSLLGHFNLPALKRRVGHGLLTLHALAPIDAGALLQLWTGAELVGGRIFVNRAQWPEPSLAEELVEVHYPHPLDVDGMGYIQQQLWMGIRLLAQHHPSKIHMRLSTLEDTLARWRKTAEDPERGEVHKRWDAGMISWLERCLADSILVRDERSLRNLLAPAS